ncbi:Nitrile hydratase-like protein (modular protein) [Hyella patelloides LEGE 07179]|uniref:Nitrile hydratase-like protein (Modular protein) n=1 Tax=Hyella patelloides LEGE 07179 TaxID=945734 RepID=A0A563VVY3_9CYAN|nr:class IIb bacteriocin, lactobin A/cerein 7B family [Hyella patelloides]VEP15570.1 Nitrile hydratase-like protein (modular protein) [Hyella patelloides LEGE 07179]
MTQTMNEQNPQRSRNEIEAHLVAQVWKDETFKQQLLANPKVVIEREFGVQLPATLNVQVMQEDADTLYITLPAPPPNVNEDELSEEDLEAVAGGITPAVAAGAGIISGIAGSGVAGAQAASMW